MVISENSCIHGDALDVLRSMGNGSVDHIITDPPYDAHTHANAKNGFRDRHEIPFDPLRSAEELVRELLRVSNRWVVAFCSMEQLGAYRDAAGDAWVRSGFWRRPDGTPQFSGDRPGQPGEGVAIMHRLGKKRWGGGGHHAYWEFCIERNDRVHPTQKPLPLMMKIIEQFTDPGELIMDPFCGSGTTCVAATRLGRRYIGVEQNQDYVAMARERISAEGMGLSLMAARSGQTSILDFIARND